MKTNPKSAEEVAKNEQKRLEQFLIPNGTECDFEVTKAVAEKSGKGNDMIHLTIKAYHGEYWKLIDDYLLSAMEAKLRHFCEATGLISQYEADALESEDCVGRSGKVVIKIKKATDEYPAKNEVRDYVGDTAKAKKAEKTSSPADKRPEDPAPPTDDDVPF